MSKEKTKNNSASSGELHQVVDGDHSTLTTNQGVPISDNQNSFKANPHGPTLMEDFILREKITHFDHERIPERIVHARGTGAHGYFELTYSLEKCTTAKILTEIGEKKPVFTRISTVTGGTSSIDTPRDVRGLPSNFTLKKVIKAAFVPRVLQTTTARHDSSITAKPSTSKLISPRH